MLPAEASLRGVMARMQEKVRKEIEGAYREQIQLEESIPALSASVLDDHYLVLTIDCPTPEALMGDTVTLATVLGLRAVDEEWEMVDLQGIPKKYWFFFGGAPRS